MPAPSLVVLAAGAGSRYRGLKQLEPIGPDGETLLEYAAYEAHRAGFGCVILVVRPEHEPAFRERLDGRMGRCLPLRYAHQDVARPAAGHSPLPARTRPWGTAHAVLAAAAAIDGPFAVSNADDYYGARPFSALAGFFDAAPQGPPLSLAVVAYEVAWTLSETGPVSRALCRLDASGCLRDIEEIRGIRRHEGRICGRDATGREVVLGESDLVSMNLWGLRRELLPELDRRFRSFVATAADSDERELLLPDVVRTLLREGRARVGVLRGDREWCGLTFREDRDQVSNRIAELVARGRYPAKLWGE